MQAAIMTVGFFFKSYLAYERLHGREPSTLEVERAWSRYEKIVLKGK